MTWPAQEKHLSFQLGVWCPVGAGEWGGVQVSRRVPLLDGARLPGEARQHSICIEVRTVPSSEDRASSDVKQGQTCHGVSVRELCLLSPLWS